MSVSQRCWSSVVVAMALWVVPAMATTNGTHRVLVYPERGAALSQLRSLGVTRAVDYGSYWVAEVTDSQEIELRRIMGDRVDRAKYLDRIELHNTLLNTKDVEPVFPAAMKQKLPDSGGYLRLVQFVGPVLPQWLKTISNIDGVKVINYIPHNTYLMWMDAQGEAKLNTLLSPNGFIQWIGAYHPQYKIQKGLMPADVGNDGAFVQVRVAVVDGPQADAALTAVRQFALGNTTDPMTQLGRRLLQLTVRAGDVATIAQLPEVAWIERVVRREPKDERQDLIMSGRISQLPGHTPVPANLGGERYLDFLFNNVGGGLPAFTNSATYPIVDVADTGLDIGSTHTAHPDFYELGDPTRPSRVVYSQAAGYPNGTACVPVKDFLPGADFDYYFGHGTFVASIVAGYASLTNVTLMTFDQVQACICDTNACSVQIVINTNIVTWTRRDVDGFQRGLGVSPFGLIGATRIFSQEPPNVTDCVPFTFEVADPVFCAQSLPVTVAQAYINRARITNNSWGDILAASPDGVFVNTGLYTADSQFYDKAVRDALLTGANNNVPGPSPLNQEMIVVFAGGNDGTIGNVGGFGDLLITAPATAKNIIAVGASENARANDDGCLSPFDQDNSLDLSGYTSFGPTLDGRFKPDLVAPGSSVFGANLLLEFEASLEACDLGSNGLITADCGVIPGIRASADLYHCGAGTSFAAPAVSGGIQLLWWYFQNRLNMLPPSPAMARAYLCNSARYLPIVNQLTGARDSLPSIGQGMGIMDLSRMFDNVPRVLRDESTPRAIDLPLMTTNPVVQQTFFSQSGQSYEVSGQIYDPTKPFRVTLAWTDAPGDPAAFKQLVNDLDLEVTVAGQRYRGNVFNEDVSTPGGAFDDVNNIESVFLPAGTTGTWSVVVRAMNIAGNGVPNVSGATGTNVVVGQDFALVIYNATPNPTPSDLPNLTTNDTCQSAIEIKSFPFVFSNQLSQSTYHNVHPSPSAGMGGAEEFFKIVVPTAGVEISADTIGSDFDTMLSVWQVQTLPSTVYVRGNCGALVEVVSNNNAPNTYTNICGTTTATALNLQSAVKWISDGSNTYYIVVEPYNGVITAGAGRVQLNVCSTQPPIHFVPSTTVNFGSVMVGASSAPRTINLTNGIATAVEVTSVRLEGDNAGDFRIVQGLCGGRLFAGQACATYVVFEPTASGTRRARLVAEYEASGSPQILELVGSATAALPKFCNVSSLQFPDLETGQSTNLTLVVTNCGTLLMDKFEYEIVGPASNDFTVIQTTCPGGTIAPNNACTLTVQFAPTTNRVRSASLVLAGDSAGTNLVQLSGFGILPAPNICIADSFALEFGAVVVGATNTQSVIITNCGTAPLVIGAITFDGVGAEQYHVLPSTDGCSQHSVLPGGTCSFSVAFIPTSIGSTEVTLAFGDNTAAGQHLISLSGQGANTQPDALIATKNKLKQYVGNNVYNTTGAGQEKRQTVKRGKTINFYVVCQNDGSAADTCAVRTTETGTGYTARYYLGAIASEGVEVTEAVRRGTFATGNLAAGAATGDATLLRVEITADRLTTKGVRSALITFTSQSNPLKTDTVKATFTIK